MDDITVAQIKEHSETTNPAQKSKAYRRNLIDTELTYLLLVLKALAFYAQHITKSADNQSKEEKVNIEQDLFQISFLRKRVEKQIAMLHQTRDALKHEQSEQKE